MHQCIVCNNTSIKTIDHRPVVLYHGFPKNESMKIKWLNVLGIDRCHDRQKICSDHFLKEHYRPGRRLYLLSNAVPQPYDRYGFPSNYATQSNGVETGNNVILPMEQNIREEHIENAVVNNFESPTQSSGLTRNNEDMPDHTLGSRRCSVKNCFNRRSKNLSLFSYPKDLTLRKKWIEKCGIQKYPATIVKPWTRVCGIHFELGCFKNTQLKNRLKPGSVPSLFIDNTPDVLPESTNEAAEQSSSEEQNNEIDNTDKSMTVDLTIDDSSNSSSITSEPIEKRTPQCILMDTEDITIDVYKNIFEMSKECILPSVYWKTAHLGARNKTSFYELNTKGETIKILIFNNNFVPTIRIYGKNYDNNITPIRTTEDLDNLLEKIDSIEKCYGRRGLVFDECIGYFENKLVNMCSGCQGLVKEQDLQRFKKKIEASNRAMESFKNIIAEKKDTVLELRRKMAEIKRNQQSRPAS